MTQFIDVKVRLAKSKLGDFLEALPSFHAQMVGYDLLTEPAPPQRASSHVAMVKRGNSHSASAYAPRQGTVTEQIYHLLVKEETSLVDLYKAFPKISKHTVDSALRRLIRFSLVTHPRHGFWRAK